MKRKTKKLLNFLLYQIRKHIKYPQNDLDNGHCFCEQLLQQLLLLVPLDEKNTCKHNYGCCG